MTTAIIIPSAVLGLLVYVACAGRCYRWALEWTDGDTAFAVAFGLIWPATVGVYAVARIIGAAVRTVGKPLSWAFRLGAERRVKLPKATARSVER